ncbi:MAG: hypothetical protein IT581_10985 [Verrucomicrobiales bacterium]|nr:hypothetical protein [Verrucomicrobiales bacterium]
MISMFQRWCRGRFLVGVLGCLCLWATPPKATGAAADGLTQAEVGQQQLQATTGKVGSQLDAVLEEFTRSQIAGDEVQLLKAIRGLLGQLSDEDMARVIELVRDARSGVSAGDRRGQLLEAFSTQKTIGLKLRQILLQYQRQQELAGVAARLEELAVRQHAAMRETLVLATAVAGRKREWLAENQRISLQLQLSEQQSLHDEVLSLLERLKAWKSGEDEESNGRAASVVSGAPVKRLGFVMDRLLADLSGGQLLSATGSQRESRRLMRQVARELLPPPDELEALQAAVREVEGILGRQEEARGSVLQLADRSPALEPVTKAQAELIDDTDDFKSVVVGLESAAAEQVGAAVTRMQEARGALESATGDVRSRKLQASTHQDLATARLETARRLLQQRIDTLEKQRLAAADPLSNLKQVRDDVADLLKREQQLKADAAAVEAQTEKLRAMAPPQGDLGDRAADTSTRAALDAPEAAEQIAAATAEMRKAQKSFGEAQNNPGAQQAAIDSLAKALATLEEKLAELAAAEKELAELEDLLARLIAVIERQQGLIGETARWARKLESRPAADLAQEQNGLAAETREIESKVPPSTPQAATYLGDASVQMILAGNELGASHAPEARPPQDEAQVNLMRAKRELEDRLARLKEMLGMPPDEPSLEDLAKMIKEAQKDVNEALSADAMEKAAKGLQKAGRQIRPATSGRLGRIPRMIRDPLQAAEQALNEGAAAAESGDEPGTSSEGGKAQEALAAAAAALDLAMAGMGQQPGQGEGQGGEGNQPGQGQGQGRGKMPGSRSGKGTGDAGNFFGQGGADGPRRGAAGTGKFIGLPARERAALLQSQGDRYPQEYAPMIEQYLKNLSDQVEAPKP